MPLDQTNWTQPTEVVDEATALLIRARALVARGWCRKTEARNLLGFPVSPYSRHAVAWCANGAMQAAQAWVSDLDYRRALLRLQDAAGERIAAFNDRQKTVEPILAAFDRAISARFVVMTDEATALLIRARALVAREWCRYVPARNFLGFSVSPRSRHATAWCMSGALYAAALVESDLDRRRARFRLLDAVGGEAISNFNDAQKTVEPILAAFDRAIAAGNPVAAGS